LYIYNYCTSGSDWDLHYLSHMNTRITRASYLFHNLTLTFGCIEAEEDLHGGKVGGLYVFRENPLPYSGFVGDRKSLLESILFYRYVVPAKIPLQYRSV
jgi:hypothetical protein